MKKAIVLSLVAVLVNSVGVFVSAQTCGNEMIVVRDIREPFPSASRQVSSKIRELTVIA